MPTAGTFDLKVATTTAFTQKDFPRALRAPSWRGALRGLLVPGLKWTGIALFADLLLSFGTKTQCGPGLIGGIFPVLLGEAWFTNRRRWRVRLLHSLGAAIPLTTLLLLLETGLGSYCQFDYDFWTKALHLVEVVGDFFYFNAMATCPGFALLVILWPPSAQSIESRAYNTATKAALLATLCVNATYGAALYSLQWQFNHLP